ncbi:centromere protein U isoform X2 [Podarcis raffonei]|uniref:centromere protein U isoform X2 n=1 Tax=Podarcis raffonei TaxID=65483 RepID=UPI00232932B2|nr:centromere protein U isoform X2 [Podarcis raffonei]XP_053258491.1 centromere protein U isoform X2 [Podarcis raffonei]XP_053258492.1 centromere protein U isoform X2 [Podarcis raffonei]
MENGVRKKMPKRKSRRDFRKKLGEPDVSGILKVLQTDQAEEPDELFGEPSQEPLHSTAVSAYEEEDQYSDGSTSSSSDSEPKKKDTRGSKCQHILKSRSEREVSEEEPVQENMRATESTSSTEDYRLTSPLPVRCSSSECRISDNIPDLVEDLNTDKMPIMSAECHKNQKEACSPEMETDYSEPREMEFSAGEAVKRVPDPVQGGFRCQEKFPGVGQSIITAPRTSRMAYEYQDLPRQMREASVEDDDLERPSRESRRPVRRRSPSPVRVYSPVRAWETCGSARRYEEEEVEPYPQPSRGYAEEGLQHPDGQVPCYRYASRYDCSPELQGAIPRQAPQGFPLSNFDLRLFPTYQPPTDVFSYLTLFEVTCRHMGVPLRMYMTILRSLICGELVELMAHLPLSQANDYERFKRLVMQRPGFHAENYRRAFRKVDKCNPSDSISVYSSKMAQNFELWLLAEGVDTFEGLRQLLLKEQFMQQLPPEIASLVANQHPATLEQATQLAESFKLKRSHLTNRGQPGGNRPAASAPAGRSAPPAKEQSKATPMPTKDSSIAGGDRSKLAPSSGLCFYCKKPGHVKAACPQLNGKKPPALTSTPAVRMIQRPAEDWEAEQQSSGTEEKPVPDGRGGAAPDAIIPKTAGTTSNAVTVGPLSTGAGPRVPHVNWANLKFTAPIEINGIAVNSFRDTGSDITSVSRDLVLPIQMQPDPLKISPYGVDEIFQPTAIVPVSYKGYTGNQLVIVHDPEVCKSPVLVGNDLGFKVHPQQISVNSLSIKVSPTQAQVMENWGMTPQALRAEGSLVPDGMGGGLAPGATIPATTGTAKTAVPENPVGEESWLNKYRHSLRSLVQLSV